MWFRGRYKRVVIVCTGRILDRCANRFLFLWSPQEQKCHRFPFRLVDRVVVVVVVVVVVPLHYLCFKFRLIQWSNIHAERKYHHVFTPSPDCSHFQSCVAFPSFCVISFAFLHTQLPHFLSRVILLLTKLSPPLKPSEIDSPLFSLSSVSFHLQISI